MPNFEDYDELKAWLETRPREEMVLFAARCALRAAPFLAKLDLTAKERAAIIAPCFRAMAAPWLAGTWPSLGAEVRDAATATANAAYATAAANAAYATAANAAYATAAAATAAATTANANAAHAAANAAHDTATAATAAAYAAVTTAADAADTTALEQGVGVSALSRRPLWPEDAVPEGDRAMWSGLTFPNAVADLWSDLKSNLLDANEGWEVWTDWYEDRLHGRPGNMELEKARVLIPDEDWDQGPAHVNAIIKRLIAQFRSKPFAETDFRYAAERNIMEMVPFAEDLAALQTDAAAERLNEILEDQHAACAELAEDILEDARQVPGSLCRDLNRYAEEAERGAMDARPAKLRRLGKSLVHGSEDDDIQHGLGKYLLPKLEEIVKRHVALQAAYHSGMLERMKELKEASLTVPPEEADRRIGAAMDTITSEELASFPAVAPELPEEVANQRAALNEMCEQIDLAPDAEERAKRIRAVEEGYISLSATIARHAVKAVEAVADSKFISGWQKMLDIANGLLELIRSGS